MTTAPADPRSPGRTVPAARGDRDRNERRGRWIAATLLLGVVVVGVVIVSLSVDEGPRKDTQGQLTEQGGAKPHIIPRPNEGQAPQDPGDPGGWEQLGLFGMIVGGLGVITLVVVRGSARVRANRAAWLAAGGSGHDGAVD